MSRKFCGHWLGTLGFPKHFDRAMKGLRSEKESREQELVHENLESFENDEQIASDWYEIVTSGRWMSE